MSARTTPRRSTRRVLTVVAASAAALLIGAGTALAHVSVTPGEVAPGGYTKLTFRVPNESETAQTNKIVIALPADTPFSSVRSKQTPGWTAELTETTLPAPVSVNNVNLTKAITSVTFTAEPGNEIAEGQFAEFDISVGPVPDVEQLLLPVAQSYTDGTVVDWNQEQAEGAEEPEHPAPVLKVVGEATEDHHGGATTGTAAAAETTGVSVAAHDEADDHEESNTGLVFGIVGTVLGALGLGAALVALRGRKKSAV